MFLDDFIDVTVLVIVTAIGGIASLAVIVMYRKEMGPFVPGTKNIVEPPNPDDIPEPEDIESESLE